MLLLAEARIQCQSVPREKQLARQLAKMLRGRVIPRFHVAHTPMVWLN